MTASTDEAREELRNRLPDVLRMAAGIAGNATLMGNLATRLMDDHPELPVAEQSRQLAGAVAHDALAFVIACEEACGIGGDV